MGFSRGKWLGRALIGLAVVLVLAGGYGLYRLYTERNALQEEVASLHGKVVLLKKKYAEQKALAEAMLRAKQAAASRVRAAQAKVAGLEQGKKEMEARLEKLGKELEKAAAKEKERVGRMKERYAELRSAYGDLRAESNRIIKEKNEKITTLTGEKQALQSSLNQEVVQHKRCRRHNGRLAELAEELVGRYEHKSVFGTVLQEEPLTQLKKVELEKLVQEYRDKIDKDTL